MADATGDGGVTGGSGTAGGGVSTGELAGELPLAEDDPEVELREDHGSRNRLADLDRRPGASGSKFRDC